VRSFAEMLVENKYMDEGNLKLFAVPGIEAANNMNSFQSTKNNAYILYAVTAEDEENKVFLSTKNYDAVEGVEPAVNARPFGDFGFVVFKKGGDGGKFRKTQAKNGINPDLSITNAPTTRWKE
jgi:hypothetical protein